MEDDNLCEKIVKSIIHIISTDKNLEEFSLIPTIDNDTNRSPIHYENHCIGLESWCKKHILVYTHCSLFELRRNKKNNLLVQDEDINNLLNVSLLLQPEVTTFWNMKRELFQSQSINFQNELTFSKLVLAANSKSSETFAYRRWIIKNLNPFILSENNVLQNELYVCDMAALKSPHNYHAWNHRMWCFKLLEKIEIKLNLHLINELNYTNGFIENHVSEHCAFHHRKVLLIIFFEHLEDFGNMNIYLDHLIDYTQIPMHKIRNIMFTLFQYSKLDQYVNIFSLIVHDLSIMDNLAEYYSGHETIWSYRKFLISLILKLFCEIFQVKNKFTSIPINMGNINPRYSDRDEKKCRKSMLSAPFYQIVLEKESIFIEAYLKSNNTITRKLVKRYKKWFSSIRL